MPWRKVERKHAGWHHLAQCFNCATFNFEFQIFKDVYFYDHKYKPDT